MIIGNETVRTIATSIPEEKIALAKAYIQGAVHSHCNNSPDKELSVRILFGGDNRDWTDTPLQCVYDYYCKKGAEHPGEDAAKYIGWLFKSVLISDLRTFEYVGKTTGSLYKLKQ